VLFKSAINITQIPSVCIQYKADIFFPQPGPQICWPQQVPNNIARCRRSRKYWLL